MDIGKIKCIIEEFSANLNGDEYCCIGFRHGDMVWMQIYDSWFIARDAAIAFGENCIVFNMLDELLYFN